ncbi:hypothetical protein [Nocardioides alcanivorans]|uniref:hypothetical protein n=1 Tax=Nocardioides alcanivorans TaxID=2897352 RepID=UPI001F3D0CE7|nr:hypothetical protein [Nocardioides alcanivorans]
MSTARSIDDRTTEHLMSSWDELLSSLAGFGRWVARSDHSVDRAEGIRHGLRYLGHLSEYLIEYNDPYRPEVTLANTPVRTLYGNSADCRYYMTRIAPEREYRVWPDLHRSGLISGSALCLCWSAARVRVK